MKKTAFILLSLLAFALPAAAQPAKDPISGLPREKIAVTAWPGGKKVAICFIFHAEVWGEGHGPNIRADMAGRKPDIIDDSWRQYAIDWGLARGAALFKEEGVPVTLSMSALFPTTYPDVWKTLRGLQPKAPIIAHGLNNTTQLLPLAAGPEAQRAYIRQTLDMIETATGTRPRGWSSPNVEGNAETFAAAAAEGATYTLDAMDSDVLSALVAPTGRLVLIPYPVPTVDMGQYLARSKESIDLEKYWIDYVSELAREAAADPSRAPTIAAIGLHPFIIGTPAGAASFRRVLEALKKMPQVWLTDVEAAMTAAGEKL
jgi:allantoinase